MTIDFNDGCAAPRHAHDFLMPGCTRVTMSEVSCLLPEHAAQNTPHGCNAAGSLKTYLTAQPYHLHEPHTQQASYTQHTLSKTQHSHYVCKAFSHASKPFSLRTFISTSAASFLQRSHLFILRIHVQEPRIFRNSDILIHST